MLYGRHATTPLTHWEQLQKIQAAQAAPATKGLALRAWAQAAAAGLNTQPTPTRTPAVPELTLHIPTREDKEKIQQWPNETTVNKIRRSQGEAGKEVVTVQRLRSGELKVFTTTTRARGELLSR
jgi:hypothetical protein